MANKIIYINNKKATINGSWLMLDPGLRVLTLHTVGNGTVTATKLSGYPGETATITPTYETYNRFSGYELIGAGSIQDNVYTFGNENADLSAVFKPNAFTAVGLWEKGSNIEISRGYATALNQSIPAKYAYLTASTGEIPASWHSTSERWNPSNASSYEATLNPKAKYGGTTGNMGNWGGGTMSTNVNGSNIESLTYKGSVGNYNKTITTTAQGMYYLNGNLTAIGHYGGYNYYGYAYYYASGTTGSWTATGYAP